MTKQKKEIFKSLDHFEPADAKFLWDPYIPLGFVTIIEGDPGLGKSWLTMQLAAQISIGEPLPGQKRVKDGSVLVLSAEDDPNITLRPRLDACGGDPSRVYFATEHFTFDETGLTLLRRNVKKHRPLLVIVDPIVAYMGGGLDMHRANETRPLFAGLAHIAADFKCAIVVVRHLTKGNNENATYRGIGSIDIIASVRSAILIDKDLDDPKAVRCAIHHKANLSRHGETRLFSIEKTKKRPGSKFAWRGTAEYDISEYTSARHKNAGAPNDSRETASAFLFKILEHGPKLASEIEALASAANIKVRTLKRAKAELGVKSRKTGGVWEWSLP